MVVLPTYSPIFDDVARIFELKVLSLTTNYEVNYEELLALASDKNVSVILFSIPHNPYGLRDLRKFLNTLYTICDQNGIFLVFDEIVFDPEISPFLNPLDCKNLVLISSYSKTYNIPGLKLGHLLASKDFVRKFYRHASTTYGSPPSFLYLTATCITTLEHAFNSHFFNNALPMEISDSVSSSNLVFDDFRIWKKFYSFNINFQHLILDAYYKDIGHVSIDKLIGIDDPSPNIILRIKGNGSAYKDSLKILARRNVSVMPIECFSPPSTWLRDIRVTVAVEPRTLAQELTDLICAIDGIYSEETRSDWLYKDDIEWLENVGLFDEIKELDGWGKSYRTCKRTLEILKLCGKVFLQNEAYRIVSLSHLGLVWKNLPTEKRKILYKKITSEEFTGDLSSYEEVLFALLNSPGKLCNLPKLPDLLKFNMFDFFRINSIEDTENVLLQAIFIASKLQWVNLDSVENIKNAFYELEEQDKLSEVCKRLQTDKLNTLPDDNSNALPSSSMMISCVKKLTNDSSIKSSRCSTK